MQAGHALRPRVLPGFLFLLSAWPAAATKGVQDVVGNKNCDEVELSPDGHWLAATRTYSQPEHGQIWQDTDANTRLVVWSCTGNELDDFVEWEDSSIKIAKIAWSPDSRFLVIVCAAANGLKPWAFPVLVFDTRDGTLHNTTPLGTIVSKVVTFQPPHTVHLSTGSEDSPQPIDFDLGRHVGDLPVLAKLRAASDP